MDLSTPIDHAGTDGREHLALVKISASGPMADFEILRPQAFVLQQLLQLGGLWRAGFSPRLFSAQCTFDLGARRAARSGAPRACSSMTAARSSEIAKVTPQPSQPCRSIGVAAKV